MGSCADKSCDTSCERQCGGRQSSGGAVDQCSQYYSEEHSQCCDNGGLAANESGLVQETTRRDLEKATIVESTSEVRKAGLHML